MKLELGKRYVRRDGGVTTIIRLDNDPDNEWPYLSNDEDGWTYDEQGRFGLDKSPRGLDLISEYIEPDEEPKPEPVAEYGPWIGWNGGHPPVSYDTALEIMQSNGTRTKTRGDNLGWHKPDSSEWSVIAYRVKIGPEVHEYELYWDTSDGRPNFTPFTCNGKSRPFTITVQGDTIKAEWVDE